MVVHLRNFEGSLAADKKFRVPGLGERLQFRTTWTPIECRTIALVTACMGFGPHFTYLHPKSKALNLIQTEKSV